MSVDQPKITNITDQIRASTYLAQGRENIRTQEQTDIVRLGNIANKTYTGENLVTKFALEIANFDNEWKWIKNRITTGYFDGLNIGDYIPVICTNNNRFNARIAGIDTYRGYGDIAIGHHIDFVSASLWPTTFKMNLVNFNNGRNSSNQSPWLSSNAYLFLNSLAGEVPNSTGNIPETTTVDYTNSGIYHYLPDSLKNVIVEKRLQLPTRFSATNIQSNDTGTLWADAGKLWLPAEGEIAGCSVYGNNRYGLGGFVQYPLFAENMKRAIDRQAWWTMSTFSGNIEYFIYVYTYGNIGGNSASTSFRAPVCFRIA